MPERNYHSFARLIPANANGVLSKEGAIPSVVDPLSGSGPFGIYTSAVNLIHLSKVNVPGPPRYAMRSLLLILTLC